MENYEKFFKSICRVCLLQENSEKMVSLVDIYSEDGLSCYGKSVITFANIEIKNNNFPDKMCEKCLFMLKQAILFKKTCEKSHEKLAKLLRKFKGTDSEFKEKVSQYVMFTQCFPQEWSPEASNMSDNKIITSIAQEKPQESLKSESDNENNFDDNSESNNEGTEINNIEKTLSETEDIFDKIEKFINLKPEHLKTNQHQNRPRKIIKNKMKHQKQRYRPKPKREQKDIKCKVCNKVLANINTYNNHMQRHLGGRYVCEHCGNKYVTNSELLYHLASTHDIGPHFICNECGYKAPRKYDLGVHKLIHTGERPYTCEKCGMTFRRQFAWRKHAVHHAEKTVQCPSCPRKFYRKSEMLAHANNIHERVYVFACSECDVTYAKPATVRRHLVEKHGIARDMQGRIIKVNLGKSSFK